MKKLIAVSCLIFTSVSLASSIVGSKQDITTSKFCKEYHCALWKSNSIDGTTAKQYWYMSVNNTLVQIIRDKHSSVMMARLAFPSMSSIKMALSDSFVKEFNMSFAGISPSASNGDMNSLCLTGTNPNTGYLKRTWLSKGPITITCELQLGGSDNVESTNFNVSVYSR